VANSYKAQAIAHELADKLKTRQALPVTESFDTDGNPLISLGDGASGDANFVIKVAAVDWPLPQDILGLAQNVYTPHTIAVATEADYAGTVDNIADPTTRAQLLPVIGQCLAMGCETRWYESAAGTAPTAGTITAGASSGAAFGTTHLKATYAPDHYRPLISQQ
jgi:hypothetical protein